MDSSLTPVDAPEDTTERLLTDILGQLRTIKRLFVALFVLLVLLPLVATLLSLPSSVSTSEDIQNQPVPVEAP